MKKKRKNKIGNKFIKVFVYLIGLIITFNIATNYAKSEDYYIENKINIIIDNNNITKNLKYDLFVNNKGTVYLSIEDVKNYFDSTVTYDENHKQIITTYGEKTAKLPLNKNTIEINNRQEDVLSGALEKDGIYYMPITVMSKIYEKDIEYIDTNKILLIDSRVKKMVKADIAKNSNIKYKTTAFSSTIDKVKRADKVIVIEHLKNNWTKVRTKNGNIGYIKTNKLQNEIYIREDISTDMLLK